MITTWVRVRRSDELAAGRGAVVRLLHGVSLFRGLDMASLEQLAASAKAIEVPAGDEPITQGDVGDRFYVIETGDAEVLINGHKVRQIGPGDEFGERALLRDTPRTATVQALTDMELLAIEREAFLEALTGEAGIRIAQTDLLTVPLVDVLGTLPAFAGVNEHDLDRLSRDAQRETLETGTVVLDVGEQSNAVYVLLSGRVELHDGDRVAAVFLPGDAFGELSVLHGTPCPGRVTVTEPAVVDVLPAPAVLSVVGAEPAQA
jgi:CRP-like cAMP-binding protein